MAKNPIDTLNELNELTLDLNAWQLELDRARTRFSDDGLTQLKLDRAQTEIDIKRRHVKLSMLYVSRNN